MAFFISAVRIDHSAVRIDQCADPAGAEIIYKAMNRGAKVDQKLVEEFKPEMEQVAANETAQAQSAPAQEAPAQDAQ